MATTIKPGGVGSNPAAPVQSQDILLGNTPLNFPVGPVHGVFSNTLGEEHYIIENVDAMDPFFYSLVSASDVWIYGSSHGPFVAGRRDPEGSMFPYQTVDRILQHDDSSGSMTRILVGSEKGQSLWEPWTRRESPYRLERNFYKSVTGTSALFEEINRDLGLVFRWRLSAGEPFGLVRTAWLENLSGKPVGVRVLDGWHRIIPPGLDVATVAQSSYLARAYMRHELDRASGMGIFTMNARLSDRAQPAECLEAACAWVSGLSPDTILLSDRQLRSFISGAALHPEYEVRGDFGAFLCEARIELKPGQSQSWCMGLDTRLDHAALLERKSQVEQGRVTFAAAEAALAANRKGVNELVAGSDGLQQTGDAMACAHHYSNVLFNIMRGGVPPHGYRIPVKDYADYITVHNRQLACKHAAFLYSLEDGLELKDLLDKVAKLNDAQMGRLTSCYLPITFSRRHGDPSRPWNHFSIRVKDENGQPVYYWQGNWRDIFQNWEALGRSYPQFYMTFINLFLNASTADGYNPYRITRDGIDWEVEDLEDPWSFIGYWGDHQIIYLLRLLKQQEAHFPGSLAEKLGEEAYAYARVPYEIVPFVKLAKDPRSSIRFNHELHEDAMERAGRQGSDARLYASPTGEVLLVSLMEKLLVPVMVKLTNLVPGGGIWMNTQRPEWNDANNALAGWGLSMVTTCAVREYLVFLQNLLRDLEEEQAFPLLRSVSELLKALTDILGDAKLQEAMADDEQRYRFIERLGHAGEQHRFAGYQDELKNGAAVLVGDVRQFLDTALSAVEVTIRANVRDDGLYNSYNVLELTRDHKARVHELGPMLEGQVSVISSGLLSGEEVLALCKALRSSSMYREDQASYILYPDRKLKPFLERNCLPDAAKELNLVKALLAEGNRSVVVEDAQGGLHFARDLTNALDLDGRLSWLARQEAWADLVEGDRDALMHTWEEVFDHRSFTGRSTTMFGFEGLGSIYWHMVSKLLLAVQEAGLREADRGGSAASIREAYEAVRDGLGFRKSPEVFGALPVDPYSHSPAYYGAQQPGMTGQVKEDVIARFGEVGMVVKNGCIHFEPAFLDGAEFSTEDASFEFPGPDGEMRKVDVPSGSLAFTYCQLPIIVSKAEGSTGLSWADKDGGRTSSEGFVFPRALSEQIFNRNEALDHVKIHLPDA